MAGAFESTAFEETAFEVAASGTGTDPAFDGNKFNELAFFATSAETEPAFDGTAFNSLAFYATTTSVEPPVGTGGGGGSSSGGYQLRKSDDRERIAKRRRELRKLDDLIRRAREPGTIAPAIAPKIAAVVDEINRASDGATLAEIVASRQQLQALLGQVDALRDQIAAIEAAEQEQDEEDVLMLLLEML